VQVELGTERKNTFLVSGTGTQNLNPDVTCRRVLVAVAISASRKCTHSALSLLRCVPPGSRSAAESGLPPPSPPHAADCDLHPHFRATSTWDAGEAVEILFDEWEDAREVRIIFWGQNGLRVRQTVGAMLASTEDVADDCVVTMSLGSGCHDGTIANTDPSNPSNLVNCIPNRVETRRVTFQLEPAARHPPKVVCHAATQPTPPPPPYSAALQFPSATSGGFSITGPTPTGTGVSSSIPEVQPHIVHADQACELGGAMTILSSRSLRTGKTEVSAVVQLGLRDQRDATVLIGASGSLLDVSRVMGATMLPPKQDAAAGLVLLQFSLSQGDHDFVFNIEGQGGMRIVRMSCRLVERAPPPPHRHGGLHLHRSPPAPPERFIPKTDADTVFVVLMACLLFVVVGMGSICLLRRHWHELVSCCRKEKQYDDDAGRLSAADNPSSGLFEGEEPSSLAQPRKQARVSTMSSMIGAESRWERDISAECEDEERELNPIEEGTAHGTEAGQCGEVDTRSTPPPKTKRRVKVAAVDEEKERLAPGESPSQGRFGRSKKPQDSSKLCKAEPQVCAESVTWPSPRVDAVVAPKEEPASRRRPLI